MDNDTLRAALVADLAAGRHGERSEFEILMWIRWADMFVFTLAEYQARGKNDAADALERFGQAALERVDGESLEKARTLLAEHTTAGRPSLSQEDARRLLRTDPSGNPYT
jgi:plasmid stabilization system protein ParE